MRFMPIVAKEKREQLIREGFCIFENVLPQQYFLMYYLVDTNPSNGSLRLIPGSHLKRHPLHDVERDTPEVIRGTDMTHPALQQTEGKVDVPVRSGHLVIGDSRSLYSAHANQSDQWRRCSQSGIGQFLRVYPKKSKH